MSNFHININEKRLLCLDFECAMFFPLWQKGKVVRRAEWGLMIKTYGAETTAFTYARYFI